MITSVIKQRLFQNELDLLRQASTTVGPVNSS